MPIDMMTATECVPEDLTWIREVYLYRSIAPLAQMRTLSSNIFEAPFEEVNTDLIIAQPQSPTVEQTAVCCCTACCRNQAHD